MPNHKKTVLPIMFWFKERSLSVSRYLYKSIFSSLRPNTALLQALYASSVPRLLFNTLQAYQVTSHTDQATESTKLLHISINNTVWTVKILKKNSAQLENTTGKSPDKIAKPSTNCELTVPDNHHTL